MGYFLPSWVQKRVLRYALSRLDFLDADALDLENLDIAWGRRSTIELRDVGLQIEVLYKSSHHVPQRMLATQFTYTFDRDSLVYSIYLPI